MKFAAVLLLAFVASAQAQFGTLRDMPFLTSGGQPLSPYWPTNMPDGSVAAIWYEPDLGGYATNSNLATLSNLTSLGASFNLASPAVTNNPIMTANLNGYRILEFAALPILKSTAFTNPVVTEYVFAISYTNTGTKFYFSGANGTSATHRHEMSGAILIMGGNGVTYNICSTSTNHFIVCDLRFTNSATANQGFTNNVAGLAAGNAGAAECRGFTLGALEDGSSRGSFALATLFAFTNASLSATARSNAFWYCTNRFKITTP